MHISWCFIAGSLCIGKRFDNANPNRLGLNPRPLFISFVSLSLTPQENIPAAIEKAQKITQEKRDWDDGELKILVETVTVKESLKPRDCQEAKPIPEVPNFKICRNQNR